VCVCEMCVFVSGIRVFVFVYVCLIRVLVVVVWFPCCGDGGGGCWRFL